jgi:hypothetical protein
MTKREQQIIEKIAKDELLIDTLETRYSDSLDFHDCCVASIKDALTAAFEAGRKAGKAAADKKQDNIYEWDDINKAMMATGHSPARILRFLFKLNEIRKGA